MRGFSLMELMIALATSSLVIAGCYQLYISQYKVATKSLSVTTSQHDLRTAVDTMAFHIEQAAYNVRSKGFTDSLISFTDPSTKIGFNIDRDENGTISGSGEYIEYSYNSGTKELYSRISPQGSSILFLDNVSNFQIKYYDDLVASLSANEIASPATNFDRIERIRIKITKMIPDLTVDSSANWKTRSIQRDVVPLDLY
jgi:prepilin-type N-terminal cleavage/methylation domain-containing protein